MMMMMVMVMVMMMMMVICTDMAQVTSDVLGMMMIARDPETGQGMTDDELRDQVITLMLAGHEVSRHTLVIHLAQMHSQLILACLKKG